MRKYLILLALASIGCEGSGSPPASDEHGSVSVGAVASADTIVVYKSATCGCCKGWADHVRSGGFPVVVNEVEDLASIRNKYGVAAELSSCHTAVVRGYAIEGHVPVSDIRRLLKERPAVAGIAVPGMPVGSPGMEAPGRGASRYNVIAFGGSVANEVFATH